MAEIFLAKAPGVSGISKFLAIKRILPQYSDNEDFIRMFKDEAKIVINLSHRNIVAMYEFGVEEKQFYIIMDYVEGKNLRQILNKMKKKDTYLTTAQIVYIIKEVAGGLDHAHRCLDSATGKPLNITHRDISPQNIMVSYDGDVRIVDFGIAKAESQLENTKAGTLKGKFGYMSPEQSEGQPVDLRTDIFSLGTVLWELIANDRLFISNNEINTLRKIRECKIPDLKKYDPNIHPELERIIKKSLAKDRNHRYQTASAMNKDLNRFLNRQYPDFSVHDLSVSIKTISADEILKHRKKLVEYSNLQFNDPQPMPEPTITKTFDGASHVSTTSENADVSEIKTRVGVVNQNVDLDIHSINNSLNNDSAYSGQRSSLRNDYYKSIGKDDSSRKRRKNKGLNSSDLLYKKNSKSSTLKTFLSVGLAGLLIVYGVFSFNGYDLSCEGGSCIILRGNITNPSTGSNHVLPTAQPSNTKDDPIIIKNNDVRPSKTFGYLMIQRKPSGAIIYINNRTSGDVTPSKVIVPDHEKFSLKLKRGNYLDYTKEDIQLSKITTKKMSITLIEAKVAYIDIDVRPPGGAQVIINNKILRGHRLPIRGFAVPSGKAVKIEARSPYSKESTIKTVTLKNREHVSLILKLKK